MERREKALRGAQPSEVVCGVNMWCKVSEVRQSICLPVPHNTHTQLVPGNHCYVMTHPQCVSSLSDPEGL